MFFLCLNFKIASKTNTPDNSLIDVKLEASIVFSPNARRQRTEFAAKAISAKIVNNIVFVNIRPDLSIKMIPEKF